MDKEKIYLLDRDEQFRCDVRDQSASKISIRIFNFDNSVVKFDQCRRIP